MQLPPGNWFAPSFGSGGCHTSFHLLKLGVFSKCVDPCEGGLSGVACYRQLSKGTPCVTAGSMELRRDREIR
jgi:hypothetical protein